MGIEIAKKTRVKQPSILNTEISHVFGRDYRRNSRWIRSMHACISANNKIGWFGISSRTTPTNDCTLTGRAHEDRNTLIEHSQYVV